MTRSADEDAYSRAVHDQAFLQGIRERYDGQQQVLDALWWLSHPTQTAPSGAASPASQLAELQRRVYSSDGANAPGEASPGVAHDAIRLQQLQSEMASEAQAIQRAITSFDRQSDVAEPTLAAADSSYETSPNPTRPSLSSSDATAPVGTPFVSRHRTALTAVGVAVALIVGIGAGTQFGTTSGIVAAPTPPASPSPSAATPDLPAAIAATFERQGANEVPVPDMPEIFDHSTFRSLLVFPTGQLFAAKTTTGMVCLVALPSAGTYTATCVAPADFPVGGLRLAWQTDASNSSDYSDTGSHVVDWSVAWKTGGTLEPFSSERVIPAPEPLAIPEASPDEALRLLYSAPEFTRSVTGAFPDNTVGYSIDSGCDATNRNTMIEYKLTSVDDPDSVTLFASLGCGTPRHDASYLSPLGSPLKLELSGDLTSVTSAYAILTPIFEGDAEPPTDSE